MIFYFSSKVRLYKFNDILLWRIIESAFLSFLSLDEFDQSFIFLIFLDLLQLHASMCIRLKFMVKSFNSFKQFILIFNSIISNIVQRQMINIIHKFKYILLLFPKLKIFLFLFLNTTSHSFNIIYNKFNHLSYIILIFTFSCFFYRSLAMLLSLYDRILINYRSQDYKPFTTFFQNNLFTYFYLPLAMILAR